MPIARHAFAIFLALTPAAVPAAGGDELSISRQEVFDFTAAPAATRDGDRVTITFTSKAWCDATVAVERPGAGPGGEPMILRHLACGVLGANAPAPFQANSLRQTIVWDGKDDMGRYVEAPDACRIRVSLGLAPRLERTLFWSPQKRIAPPTALASLLPVMVPTADGVYVCEGGGGDRLCLYDHDGNYVRTIYPFPADAMAGGKILGLKTVELWPGGKAYPVKWTLPQTTLLTSADLRFGRAWPCGGSNAVSPAATAMAVRGGRIALANARLNRLATDGTTGGLPLGGPVTSFTVKVRNYLGYTGDRQVGPRSAAISPDGKWVYMTGFRWGESWGTGGSRHRWLDGVVRVPYGGQLDAAPEIFKGRMDDRVGTAADDSFRTPCSVAIDAKGRIYVADYMNDRVQVFDDAGKLLRSVKAAKPVKLVVDDKGDALYVFSWLLINSHLEYTSPKVKVELTMTKLAPLDAPKPSGSPVGLPFRLDTVWNTWDHFGGTQVRVALDTWADPLRLWVAGAESSWAGEQIRIYQLQGDRWTPARDFARDAAKAVTWVRAPHFGRQRLYCNPQNGWVYAGEQHQPSNVLSKSISELIGIDPATGRVKVVPMPFDGEDLAFDQQGLLYVRTTNVIARFTGGAEGRAPWREVPFDYGEERHRIGNQGFRTTDIMSGVVARGHNFVSAQEGGMAVSPRGHIALTLDIEGKLQTREGEPNIQVAGVIPYEPRIYPGRAVQWVVHLWDQHGQLIQDDLLPGMGICSGISIDKDDNLYMMASARRLLDGKSFANDAACTLLKTPMIGAKVLCNAGAVPLGAKPERPPDLSNWRSGLGPAWVEGAKWFYGGVGLDSHSIVAQIRACHCEAISKPAFDAFARTFAPEINRCDVVVLDSNGNTICRIGRWGSVDDGRPLVADGGPASTRQIGGDEVALVHPSNMATDTDHRLFISDLGNARIVSVKLDYHKTATLKLADISRP
ncbi:MAG: hypothetical protein BIFFINMI_03255 [Phycisphaerae bacterium]|nr:hypothetical protein [Phycisphaerae bacterium]